MGIRNWVSNANYYATVERMTPSTADWGAGETYSGTGETFEAAFVKLSASELNRSGRPINAVAYRAWANLKDVPESLSEKDRLSHPVWNELKVDSRIDNYDEGIVILDVTDLEH